MLALRDVSQFIVGASVQYYVNGATRDVKLQTISARTRNAVLHAVENIQLPAHLSKLDLGENLSDTFRLILPDTMTLVRKCSLGGPPDDYDIDAIDALCAKLCDRQVLNRVSDREMMHSVTQIIKSIELSDDPGGQTKPTRPRVFAVNCEECHVVGESQLAESGQFILPVSNLISIL